MRHIHTETEFLNTDRQAELLATIFVHLPDTQAGFDAGDAVLCDLIEMGLVDQDQGPLVYQAWKGLAHPDRYYSPLHEREFPDGYFDDVDVLRRVLEAVYMGEDDLFGHCDTCGLPCDEDGCVLDRDHRAALTETEAAELEALA